MIGYEQEVFYGGRELIGYLCYNKEQMFNKYHKLYKQILNIWFCHIPFYSGIVVIFQYVTLIYVWIEMCYEVVFCYSLTMSHSEWTL